MNLRLPSLPLALLLIAALLAPIIGGQISVEVHPLIPGFANLIVSAFDGMSLPTAAHAILGSLVIGSGLVMLAKRKVIQVPNMRIMSVLLVFLAILLASVLNSHMRAQSQLALAEWFTCAVVLFTVVCGAGRGQGPKALVAAVFVACVYLARNGIWEFRSQADPTWRIFAGWEQPNALAGMLIIGILAGIGLMLSVRPIWAIVVALGTGLIGYAMLLTQSKGGLLALAAGLAIMSVLIAAAKVAPKALPWLGRAAIALVVLSNIYAIFLTKMPQGSEGVIVSGPSQGSSNVLTRLRGGATADQSVGFRKLLFTSSIKLIAENPVGYGIGTYRLVSSKPGLVAQTQLAHNTLLQLGVEASPLAPICFLIFLWLWLELTLKDAANIPWRVNALRMSIVAAVLATMLHGAVESNLYTFGICFVLFLMLGVGIQLSADASSPEFARPNGKIVTGLVLVGAAAQLWLSASIEALRSELRAQELTQQLADAQQTVSQLKDIGSFDGEVWYEAGRLANPRGRIEDFQKAADLEPLPRNFRALAAAQASQGLYEQARSSLNQVLVYDPNNMPGLLSKMLVEDAAGDKDGALGTARRLIDVEKTLYFKIRALPDIIPTETAEARTYLADHASDAQTKASLLQAAVDTYDQFLKRTFPSVLQMAKEDPNGAFGGISLASAKDTLEKARKAAAELAGIYRAAGDGARAKGAEEAGVEFANALGDK